ncbi:zinc-binding dehydrogenase, partial [Mesorhizobium sp. M8A.F.Ca.ET.198.01.1.1]|uniref:zinc-binding dehydrogenase n=1 Tax=Mesorhizobium sp. M8A.F.Ca.ET.198.01.1.1 TaxID=2563966 RepID=UPI001135D6C8
FVAAVSALTQGRKCDVVYDSVGADTFPASLDCLRPLGTFASFGQSSGSIPPFSMSILAQKGSLFVTRPTLFVYNARREDMVKSAEALFDVVKSGAVKIVINQ